MFGKTPFKIPIIVKCPYCGISEKQGDFEDSKDPLKRILEHVKKSHQDKLQEEK